MRRSFALVVLGLLAASCSGSTKPDTLPVDKALIGGYAATIGAVSAHLHTYADGLTPCTGATYDCIFDIVSAGAAAQFLSSHLAEDGDNAYTGKTIPSSLTSLVAATESDVATVMKQAANISRFSAASITGFRTVLSALLTDVDAWQPTGSAGLIMSADDIRIPITPAANLHVHFNVRPLLYIKQGQYFPTFTTTSGEHCQGSGALSDLKRGAGVTIYDAGGQKVVGLGFVVRTFVAGERCGLVADVKNLPPENFYQVRFANRNKVAFSARQLLTQTAYTTVG